MPKIHKPLLKLLSKIANRRTKNEPERAKEYHLQYRQIKARRRGFIALRHTRVLGLRKRRATITLVKEFAANQKEFERENQGSRTWFSNEPKFEIELEKILGKKTKRFLKTFYSIKE